MDAEKPHLTMAGYTPLVGAVHDLTDWVKALYTFEVGVRNGGNPPRLPPTARPVTAFDRLADEQRRERHRHRVQLMIGG